MAATATPPAGYVSMSVDLGATVATWTTEGGALTNLAATDNACGALFQAVSLPSGIATPTFQQTSVIAGESQTLPLAAHSPGAPDQPPPAYFYLKNKASGTYLSALYEQDTDRGGGEATTLFQLACNAKDADGALICALVSLETGQGAQANTLLVWLDAEDPEPKAMCMSGGTPIRAYAFPPTCYNGATGADCDLQWQACNKVTGYCADASLLTTAEKTGAARDPALPLAFPNCVGRRLAGLFTSTHTSTTAASQCLSPSQVAAEVATHTTGVAQESGSEVEAADNAEVLAFLDKARMALLGGLLLVFVVILAILVMRYRGHQARAAAARVQLAKLRRAAAAP